MADETTGFRILLADDNPVNRDLGRRLLEKRGHKVVLVENGREALGNLENESYDVVLMDLEMPEMDGFEATRMIRQKESGNGTPKLPVIAMTAYDENEMADRIQEAGFSGIITKPVNPKTINDQLHEIVNNMES